MSEPAWLLAKIGPPCNLDGLIRLVLRGAPGEPDLLADVAIGDGRRPTVGEVFDVRLGGQRYPMALARWIDSSTAEVVLAR